MQDVIDRDRVESPIQVQGSGYVGMQQRRIETRKPSGGVRQDIQIRIQQRQAETQREACPLEEVARARSYIKMATAQILGLVLHEQTCGASPHEVCKQAEYQQVIHSEEPAGMEVLTCVCGIRGVHL